MTVARPRAASRVSSTGHGRTDAPARASSTSPRSRRSSASASPTPGTSCTSSAGRCATCCSGRTAADLDFATERARRARPPRSCAGWADRQYLVGVRFGTVGALKDGQRLEITTFRAGGLRRGAPQARGDVRRGRRDGPVAPRLHDQRDGDPLARTAGSSTRSAACGTSPRASLDTPLDPEVVLRRRPAADGARRAVRRAARRHAGAARRRGDGARCANASRSCRPNGSATSSTSCSWPTHAATGLALLVETGLADRFLPELPALRLEQDPVHHHKDVLRHTYAVVERHRAATACCGSRRCCTTSASRRRAEITPDGVHVPPPRGGRRPDGARAARRAALPRAPMIDDVAHADRAAPALPRVRRGVDRRARCAGTSATPGRCSTT